MMNLTTKFCAEIYCPARPDALNASAEFLLLSVQRSCGDSRNIHQVFMIL